MKQIGKTISKFIIEVEYLLLRLWHFYIIQDAWFITLTWDKFNLGDIVNTSYGKKLKILSYPDIYLNSSKYLVILAE